MNPEQVVRRGRQAALKAGAAGADAFHRSSRTRILVLEAGGVTWSERSEEGLAVQAWAGAGPAALAAASTGADPEVLGQQAARAAGVSGRGGAPPAGTIADPMVPGSAAPPADAEEGTAEKPETVAAPAVFDPEVLRASRRELEQRLRDLAGATGIARRAGLPQATQAILRLAILDRHLLSAAGQWHSMRSTLTSFRLRFPSAFGLSAVEMVSRRLGDMETTHLIPWLAAHPTPVRQFQRWRAVPAEDGEATLTLAPPVMAVLLTSVAARAAATGHSVAWGSGATLRDDPLLPWGPASAPVDGDGATSRVMALAGPAAAELQDGVGEQQQESPLALAPVRLSYREPPRALPTNLILEGLPSGSATAAGANLHLLDVVTHHGRWCLVRAALRRREGGDLPVLLEIPSRLETFLSAAAVGGPAHPFLVSDAFVSTPAVTIPGWTLSRLP